MAENSWTYKFMIWLRDNKQYCTVPSNGDALLREYERVSQCPKKWKSMATCLLFQINRPAANMARLTIVEMVQLAFVTNSRMDRSELDLYHAAGQLILSDYGRIEYFRSHDGSLERLHPDARESTRKQIEDERRRRNGGNENLLNLQNRPEDVKPQAIRPVQPVKREMASDGRSHEQGAEPEAKYRRPEPVVHASSPLLMFNRTPVQTPRPVQDTVSAVRLPPIRHSVVKTEQDRNVPCSSAQAAARQTPSEPRMPIRKLIEIVGRVAAGCEIETKIDSAAQKISKNAVEIDKVKLELGLVVGAVIRGERVIEGDSMTVKEFLRLLLSALYGNESFRGVAEKVKKELGKSDEKKISIKTVEELLVSLLELGYSDQ